MIEGKIIADTYRISPTSGRKVLKVPKLLELHEKLFNTTPSNLHNSLIDIYVCLRCYYKLEYDVDILNINNRLLDCDIKEITHSYPHCWRCKKPVIFRATEQWFISIKNNIWSE